MLTGCRSIVNGLRADDAESFYPRRGSFESELSTSAQHDVNGSEQLFFKEHVRTGSKGSIVSNPGRRRSQMPVRPETKVIPAIPPANLLLIRILGFL